MEYYLLTDEEYKGEIIRKSGNVYQRFIYGTNEWMDTKIFEQYLRKDSPFYNKFKEKNEREVLYCIAKQIEEYGRLWHIAYQLAYEKHSGKVDKGGVEYFLHPLHVSKQFEVYDFKIVGILHDIVEDTDVTIEYLQKLGYPKKILEAIDAITKRENEDYMVYIERLKKNSIAKAVKQKDLLHNLDPERLKHVKNREFYEKKYNAALELLLK